MVTVRAAQPTDADAMLRIHTDALHHHGAERYTDAQLRRLAPTDADPEDVREHVFGEDRYAAVAEKGGEVIGFGGVRLDDGSLLGIFVDPAHGGAGVGTGIIGNVESRARDAGLETLTVFAALNAVEFYEACGFERVGRRDATGAEGPVGTYESDGLELPAVEMRAEVSRDGLP
jgi:GNAT superfamily N-acetyltransferase